MRRIYDAFASKTVAAGTTAVELNYEEFLSVIRAENLIANDAPEEFVSAIFQLVDTDNSGTVSWDGTCDDTWS